MQKGTRQAILRLFWAIDPILGCQHLPLVMGREKQIGTIGAMEPMLVS